jgi:indole-3-glycerol phosphate synthase
VSGPVLGGPVLDGKAPQAPDFLARMARASAARVAEASARRPEARLRARSLGLPLPPPLRLSPARFDVIAEVKRRSPAAGRLAGAALRVAAQGRSYVRGGAAALSVLTEPTEFQGELAHLTEVAAAAGAVPCMRKDFIVAPYQLYEARVAGAGGVLLIVAMLDDARLRELVDCALELGLFVLLEAFDLADIERLRPLLRRLGPPRSAGRVRYLVGVNCRDLRTLQVDFSRFATLARALPAGIPKVAESGVESVAQAARVAELGYEVALVGTALMRAPDPARLLAELLAAGRSSTGLPP